MKAPWVLLSAAAAALLTGMSSESGAAGPTRRIEVQGHRGARAVLPENTLPAFDHALEVGADVLELDLHVTRDDHLVVVHDPLLSPTLCLGPEGARLEAPVPVRDLTLEALKRYDCGSLPNPRFPRQVPRPGTPIPTLDELFEWVRRSPHPGAARVGFNIEMKLEPAHPERTPSPEEFAALVVAAVRARKLEARVVVQSFDHRAILAVKRRAPKLRTAMLVSDSYPDPVAVVRGAKADILSPHHEWITAEGVKALHRAGLRVVPWTANTPAAWDRLIALGVDGIITDDPAALIAHLEARGLRE